MKMNESTENNSLRSHLEAIDTQVRKIAIYLGISAIPDSTETPRLLIDELTELAEIIAQRLDSIYPEMLKLASKKE